MNERIGFALTGSFCTFAAAFKQMELLAEKGYQVTAVDYTVSMLTAAAENAGEMAKKIRFQQMNAEKLEFAGENNGQEIIRDDIGRVVAVVSNIFNRAS